MRPDFSLIWGADNAPFTAIEASDYTAGWVFRTGAPPRRVNFDYFQNLSDQRTAWLGEQMLLAVGHEWQDDVTYDAYAVVRSPVNGQLYRSLSGGNLNNEPSVSGAQWAQGVADSADLLNAPIATVAAAGTINLTTGAPDTSQLAISGTGATINGFTVAANRFFVVKMTGASNTLVNSASLVTGRGENIVAVSGDTFLMRATAANTVEILCYVSRGIRLGTAQSPLSGTSTDFIGIPPGASRVTVMLSGVSTNGGSSIQVQLGSGSIETTGYNGAAEINAASTANTTGLQVNRGQDAASLTTGSATLNRIDGNRWIISGTFWLDNVNRVGYVAGGKTVSGGAIDRVRITTVNGTDVFDAGQANITWELGG